MNATLKAWMLAVACCALMLAVKRVPVAPVRVLQIPHEILRIGPNGVALTFAIPYAMYVDEKTEAVMQRGWFYRYQLIVAARRAFGLDAPIAMLAGQIHAESAWRANAVSPAGAVGMTQFMPATADSMGARYKELIPVARTDADWSLRAQALHMHELFVRFEAVPDMCERAAFALSEYNGGQKYLELERAQARDKNVWFGDTERRRVRGVLAWNENRAYPRLILRRYEPMYRNAGYPAGRTLCI